MKRLRLLASVGALLLGTAVLFAAAQTDNFNRADESPLASPWIAPDGVTDSKFLLSSFHLVGSALTTVQLMYYNFAFSGNHYSQATLGGSDLTNVATYAYAAVRIQSSGQSAYVYGIIAGATSYKIQKIVSGTFTALQTCSGTPTAGDVVKLSVSGSSLTGTVNGGSTCSASDGALSGGRAGLGGYNGSGAYTFDDWSGDDVAGGGGGGCTGALLLLGAGKC